MAKSSVSQWDSTADNNLDVGGISLAENVMAPPAVNNALREMMAQVKDFYDDLLHEGAGMVGYFYAVPTSGWLKADGKTIGNGSSGATARANADTETLFKALWAAQSNTLLPIQDSSGTASTRGASAAADFSANKRLPLPDLRAEFIRGLDDSRGVDAPRALGSSQDEAFKSHTHTATVTDPGHNHSYTARLTGASDGQLGPGGFAPVTSGTTGNKTTGITVANSSTGGTETRPRNVALYACIKY